MTTFARDTKMTDEWIAEACKTTPLKRVDATSFITGPVRLAFPELAKPAAYKDEEPKYKAKLLFPTCTNFAPVKAALLEIVTAKWPDTVSAGRIYGPSSFENVFEDQGKGAKFAGFLPGAVSIFPKSRSKPALMDAAPDFAPLADASKFYPGAWVVCGVSLYVPKEWKKVYCALNWVSFYADDQRLGGADSMPHDAAAAQAAAAVRSAAPIAVPDMGVESGLEDMF